MNEVLVKTSKGFEITKGMGSYTLKYDAEGKYVGQLQPDMLSENSGADEMFLKTYPGDPCYHELSADDMRSAYDPGSIYELVREQSPL